MRILVQKFGGTSVVTPEKRQCVLRKVLAARQKGFAVVVVVSAPGRKGEPYATDTLLELARQENEALSQRETDMIMSCGEVVAGVLVVGSLTKAGVDAVLLNGRQAGIVTSECHGEARILHIEADRIRCHLDGGKVVVVTGFQGVSETGEVTTLGRGGSDTSAVAIGAALAAEEVEIYTDVDGVMTADPRLVPNARIHAFVPYEGMLRFAGLGAKVVHPRAIEIAMKHQLPVRVKNTLSEAVGTLIAQSKNGCIETGESALIIGLTHQTDCVVGRLWPKKPFCQQDLIQAMDSMEEWEHAFIDLTLDKRVLTVVSDRSILEQITGRLAKLQEFEAEVTDSCARLVLSTYQYPQIGQLALSVIRTLSEQGIPVSNLKAGPDIAWLVKQSDLDLAVQAVHKAVLEQPAIQ